MFGLATSAVTAAAVESATAGEVGSAAARKSASSATTESASAAGESAGSATDEGMTAANIAAGSACVSAAIAIAAAEAVTRVNAVAIAAAITAAVVGAAIAPAAVIPRARADEDTAHEPVRAVVTVGGTGIGRIAVVPIRADRRCRIGIRIRINRCGSGIGWVRRNTDADTERNLRVRFGRRHQNDAEHSQQRDVFEKPHLVTSWARNFEAGSGVLSGSQ